MKLFTTQFFLSYCQVSVELSILKIHWDINYFTSYYFKVIKFQVQQILWDFSYLNKTLWAPLWWISWCYWRCMLSQCGFDVDIEDIEPVLTLKTLSQCWHWKHKASIDLDNIESVLILKTLTQCWHCKQRASVDIDSVLILKMLSQYWPWKQSQCWPWKHWVKCYIENIEPVLHWTHWLSVAFENIDSVLTLKTAVLTLIGLIDSVLTLKTLTQCLTLKYVRPISTILMVLRCWFSMVCASCQVKRPTHTVVLRHDSYYILTHVGA